MILEKERNASLAHRSREFSSRIFTRFTPPALADNPEQLRRARLIIGFALLGGIFGLAFATFYTLIEHYWGAAIIFVCCAAFASIPFILKHSGSSARAGNFYCLVLNIGFYCLCWVEGGVRGHAVAWLVTIPLLALLLTSRKAAYAWGFAAFGAMLTITAAEFTNYAPPIAYPHEWHETVTALGYVSLVAFMFILGLIFENGRAQAQARMLQTLSELAEANNHLTKLHQEKSEFLGIAAHDLKNPLTVVMAYSDMILKENKTNPRLERFASSIRKESARMRDLISNLLDLNSLELGGNRLELVATEVGPLVARSVENQQSVAQKKQIRITLSQEEGLIGTTDANALLQILDNLISNAVKFSPPGAEVKVKVSAANGRMLLQVVDEGPGIKLEDREKLFKRFSKLSARPTAGESSNGLGLSIVKQLVEAMHGTVECEGDEGKGATFTVSLPGGDPMVQRVTGKPVDTLSRA